MASVMQKIPFPKAATTYQEQLQQLKNRGMAVQNDARAIHYLSHLNYYRLSAYWLPFEQDHHTHQFMADTSFDDVLNLYVFDRELRLLMIDAIERIEVSMRSKLAYHLSHKYGSHVHLQSQVFHNQATYNKSVKKLTEEVSRSKESFIQHLKSKYSEPLPPVWAVVELMTLGQLSSWYDNLQERSDRKIIADGYGLDEKVLRSFFHHLSIIRNLCAHHSRVWNRDYVFSFVLPKKGSKKLVNSINRDPLTSKKIYNALVMLAYCMDVTCPQHHWKQRLKDLVQQHHIEVEKMGFPQDWQQWPVWQL